MPFLAQNSVFLLLLRSLPRVIVILPQCESTSQSIREFLAKKSRWQMFCRTINKAPFYWFWVGNWRPRWDQNTYWLAAQKRVAQRLVFRSGLINDPENSYGTHEKFKWMQQTAVERLAKVKWNVAVESNQIPIQDDLHLKNLPPNLVSHRQP